MSMATVNYTLRLDETDKQAAERIFDQLGLTLAAGFNIYVKAVVRQQKIPFELSLLESNPFYSEENQARLALSKKQIAAGNVIYKTGQELGLDDE